MDAPLKNTETLCALLIGGALQRYVDGNLHAGIGIGVGDGELLVDRLGRDGCAEEVVVIFAVEQSRKIRGALLQHNGEGKALLLGKSGVYRGNGIDAHTRTRAANEPVDTRAGEWRVDACSVELDAVVGTERTGLVAENQHGLLDAFGVELKSARVGVRIESCGDELSFRDLVPAFALDRNFYGCVPVQRYGGLAWRGSRDNWPRRG